MRIYINATVLALFKELFEIVEVVSTDKYARTVANTYAYLRYFRISVCCGIRFIEQCHSLYSPLSHC